MKCPAFEKRHLSHYSTLKILSVLLLGLILLNTQSFLRAGSAVALPTYCETAGEISVLLSEDQRSLNVDAEVFCVSSPIIAAYLQIATDKGLFKASVDLTSFAEGSVIDAVVDPRPFLSELMEGKVYLEILTLNDLDGKFIGKLGVTEVLVVSSNELFSVNLLEQRRAAGLDIPIELRLNTMENHITPILDKEESDSMYLRMAPIRPKKKSRSGQGS